jgi:primosomal protein N' (replication factor Y)
LTQIIKVLVPKIGLFPLDYASKKNHAIGELVVVPFRNKKLTGIVWEIGSTDSVKKLKEVVDEQIFPAKISSKVIELIKSTSDYYLTELGSVAKLVLPVDVNETPLKIFEQNISNEVKLHKLSDEQQKVLEQIENTQKPVLIKGVTGSGKTEIYFGAAEKQLKVGKQILIMLPEIALSQQIISRFKDRFGFEPAIWNSSVTKAQKKRILRGIINGSVRVVIGARSALFLPYKELGIIVVDEEHDSSYKQAEGMLYNARDMAVLRAHIEKCKVLLVSATPSIESIYNAKISKYHLVTLKSRYNDAVLPDVEIVDMRQESLPRNFWLSEKVTKSIEENIKNKQQTLIFLNRRGYAPLVLCKGCGYRFECKSCSSSMVMHKSTSRLECHHCGAASTLPKICPECRESDTLILCGPGIERIAEEVNHRFPDSKIAMVSREQSESPREMQELLQKMQQGEIDILIGTQIVTKGYHFPQLTLVVVVDADVGFMGGDLRAAERTFQLLHQVGGRAGREDKKGMVLLQTYCPDHKVINALVDKREDLFVQEELSSREEAEMPPFAKMAAVTITGKNQEKTLSMARRFVSLAPTSSARILGPTEAMMLKLSGKYRYKILVIADKKFHLQKYLELWKDYVQLPSSYQLKIDVDPYNFV